MRNSEARNCTDVGGAHFTHIEWFFRSLLMCGIPACESEQRIAGPFCPQEKVRNHTLDEWVCTARTVGSEELHQAQAAHLSVNSGLSGRKSMAISADKDGSGSGFLPLAA